jgi:hypothetical protein
MFRAQSRAPLYPKGFCFTTRRKNDLPPAAPHTGESIYRGLRGFYYRDASGYKPKAASPQAEDPRTFGKERYPPADRLSAYYKSGTIKSKKAVPKLKFWNSLHCKIIWQMYQVSKRGCFKFRHFETAPDTGRIRQRVPELK